jgi:ACS family hexuronate transporter-like MFS transporter
MREAVAANDGFILQRTHSYVPLFGIASTAYLIALALIHLLALRLEPARVPPA